MFSWKDIYVLYTLEMKAAQYNKKQSAYIMVCNDINGVKQTYAIVFEKTGSLVENTLNINTPENIGCTQTEIIDKLHNDLGLKYQEESEKTNPNYERVFLQFNFGTNIGLYKANSDLTNWSKLTITHNSDDAVITPSNCN